MKANKLFEAIGGAKDKYLEKSERRRLPFVSYSGWIACAACICIAVISVMLFKPETIDVAEPDNIKLESISSNSIFSIEGMGFEAHDEFSMNEKLKYAPIDVAKTPATLPVFKNLSYNPYTLPYGLDEGELMELVWDVLEGLGIDPFAKDLTNFDKTRVSDTRGDPRGFLLPDDSVLQIRLTASFGFITVYADGTVEIQYTNGIALPEEYSIKDEPRLAMEYLCKEYSALLDYDNPKIIISEKLLDSGISSSITVYDNNENLTEDLLNYIYEKSQFIFNDDGSLSMIRINNLRSVAECIGQYPTISAEEAEKLLLSGTHYSTYSGEVEITADAIRGVELTYRTSDVERMWLPFYRFYVEMPPNEYTGKIAYAAYYVPAIEHEYIKTEYSPDFSFNN